MNMLWVVAAALIDPDGRVLVQQRGDGRDFAGLWEFPGGKVEFDELPEAALIRELHEELGIEVAEVDLEAGPFASAPLDDRHLLLLLYLVRRWRGIAVALDAEALQWCDIAALRTLPMPPADGPLVEALAALI